MRALLLLLASSTAAMAQDVNPASFFPYATGNRWEYVTTSQLEGNSAIPPLTKYTTLTVLRDTVIDGHSGAAYVVARLDSLQSLLSESLCSGYRDESRWIASSLDCVLPSTFSSDQPIGPVSTGGTVEISGQVYPVEAVAQAQNGQLCGSGGTQCRSEWRHAAGIGLYYWRTEQTRTLSPTYSVVSQTRLAYARVGDQVFGAAVVSNEPDPNSAPRALYVTAFPNPTRSQIQISVQGLSAGPLNLALYDALGRYVWGREGGREVAADLRTLPAGVYTLRVIDRVGAVATTGIALTR